MNQNKIAIFVDFDECLIHGFNANDGRSPTHDEVKKQFETSVLNDEKEPYVIVLRPGAKEFLKDLHKITPNVFILTAGLKDFQSRAAKSIGLLPLVKALYGRDSKDVPIYQYSILIDDMWPNSSNSIHKFAQMGVIDSDTKERADHGPWNPKDATKLLQDLSHHFIQIKSFDATNMNDRGFDEIVLEIKPRIDYLVSASENLLENKITETFINCRIVNM